MADCAASFAIDRLFQLLEEESKLLKGVRREVESLRAELQIIQPYLRDADERAERGEIHDGLKALAKQVRQVSYRIEDVMDGYILYLAQRPQRGGLMGFLCKIDCVITKLEQRHEIASEIQDIRTSIREIRERINTYGLRVIDDGSSSRRGWKSSASRHGSPMASLVLDEAEVVGIESARDTLISWMVKEASSSRRMVISVVGTGGVGKTTLVKKVYDKQVSSGTFVCHAWIPVSESYKIEKILVTLLKQLHKATTKELSSPPAAFEAKEMMRLIRDVREYLTKAPPSVAICACHGL